MTFTEILQYGDGQLFRRPYWPKEVAASFHPTAGNLMVFGGSTEWPLVKNDYLASDWELCGCTHPLSRIDFDGESDGSARCSTCGVSGLLRFEPAQVLPPAPPVPVAALRTRSFEAQCPGPGYVKHGNAWVKGSLFPDLSKLGGAK